MKSAVSVLMPYIEAEKGQSQSSSAGKVVFATVKGDVHDIGKNIVSVVLQCNNFEVIDLGVMVLAENILETAKRENADIIALSGLITPSLEEMAFVAAKMEKEGFKIPLMVGGATTSKTHTALKIAPEYSHGVVHTTDASKAVEAAKKLVSIEKRDSYLKEISAEYENVRNTYKSAERKTVDYEFAKTNSLKLNWKEEVLKKPEKPGIHIMKSVPLNVLREFIDWSLFYVAWDMKGVYPRILEDPIYGEEAKNLYRDANIMLDRLEKENVLISNGVFGLFPADSEEGIINVYSDEDKKELLTSFNVFRQQEELQDNIYSSLSDYIAPKESGKIDYIGGFIVTSGIGAKEYADKLKEDGDEYGALMVRVLADRLAEAFAEYMHLLVRKEYWGFSPLEDLSKEDILKGKYRGIRPAFGYPSLRDHSEKTKLFELLEGEKNTGVYLTESYMMDPTASVCGLYFGSDKVKYFNVNRITKEQLSEYAIKSKKSEDEIKKSLHFGILN